MSSPTLAQLAQLTQTAMQSPAGATRVRAFLDGLGPLHNDWHDPQNPRRIGFLTFHWEVIKNFKAVGGPADFGGIQAFTLTEFRNFGAPYNADMPVTRGNRGSLQAFSVSIGNWHNSAHRAIMMSTGLDMMDPLTNIKIREFWRLHYFINAKFEQKLRAFRQSSSQTIPTVIAQLEATPTSVISRI